MLHKSFKPAKCKTSLNLAKSRLKLLKNKKEVQVGQLKRELAHLLESGQDQTARIRVEHVVREEKTMAAYELIELYCELIVARLPIIESQKNCPIDLKEAIASILFAAPRCGDIPELQDVCKHFTSKYGKEFVAAAIELRPACGTSKMMVEKLSTMAPDGPMKVKILTDIAAEHNVNWEPNWFKDEAPAPSADTPKFHHMEKGNTIQMEPLNFEISDAPQQKHSHDAAGSATSQSSVHAHINAHAVPQPSASPHVNPKPSESASEKISSSQSSRTAEDAYSMSGKNWNMDFKDAASAAQAAAESAEQASMAARAAAELSTHGKVITDFSSGPSTPSVHGWSRDNSVYASNVSQQEYVDRNPTHSLFNHIGLRRQRGQENANEVGNMKESDMDRYSDEDRVGSGIQFGIKSEGFGESKGRFNPVHDMGKPLRDTLNTSQAGSDVFETSNQEKYGNEPAENPFYGETQEMKNQPSNFQSQSSPRKDEYNVFSEWNDKNKKNDSEDAYFGDYSQGTTYDDDYHFNAHSGSSNVMEHMSFKDQQERDTFLGSDEPKYGFHSSKDIFGSMDHRTNEKHVGDTGTHTGKGAVFDESGSDDDNIFDDVQKSHDFPSPVKSPPNRFPSHQETTPGNWDHQSSFSSQHHCGLDVSESFRESPLYSKLSEPVPIKFDSDGSSSEIEEEPQNDKTHPDTNLIGGTAHKKSPRSSGSNLVSESQHEAQSSPEGGMGLNLGLLPGGYRNRPLRCPPYTRGALVDDTSSRSPIAAVDDAFGANQQTSPVLKSQASSNDMENTQVSSEPRKISTHFDSTVNDPEVVTQQAERPYRATLHEDRYKTSSNDPSGYFDSDDSNPEENVPEQPPKQSVMSKTQLGARFSQRTKPTAPRLDHIGETGSPLSSRGSDASTKLQTETSTSRFMRPNPSGRDEEAISRPRPQRRVSEEKMMPSSVSEKQRAPPKVSEASRTSNNNEKAPSRENSLKNPRHVHPKLPDFESLTAHLQSLRTGRQ